MQIVVRIDFSSEQLRQVPDCIADGWNGDLLIDERGPEGDRTKFGRK